MLASTNAGFALLSITLALTACGPRGTVPGFEPVSQDARAQTPRETPVDAFGIYLNGFHFYAEDPDVQVEDHRYVTAISEDTMQAVIFEEDTPTARLMGVETIISPQLFDALPDAEKRLWHRHDYEVKSGLLIAPGLTRMAERALMDQLASTYGKVWYVWHTNRATVPGADVPLGEPALMMAFTADGQLDPALLAARDRRLGVDSREIAQRRAGIATASQAPHDHQH
jgi:hypothetical protein